MATYITIKEEKLMKKMFMKKVSLIIMSMLLFVVPCTAMAGDNKEPEVIDLQEERGGGGNECYQYVKNIRQTKTYNCGMTNVLQALYGMGYEDEVPGDTDAEKIQAIDTRYNIDTYGQTYVYQIKDALNYYMPGSSSYEYTLMNNVTISEFENIIATSLTYCKPVILHAITTPLDYYNGHKNYHYLCIDYINRSTDIVRIVDCHVNDPYYGVHYVTLQEAYETVTIETGRYIIH